MDELTTNCLSSPDTKSVAQFRAPHTLTNVNKDAPDTPTCRAAVSTAIDGEEFALTDFLKKPTSPRDTSPREFQEKGALICMVGLPCSGKSSVTKELGNLSKMTVFCEPEEQSWADCVTYRNLSGHFGAHMWFRSVRTCQLYQAKALVTEGQTVFVDSYLDKLLYFCLGRRGMDWLLHPDDQYFDVARHMARIDLESLPLANYLIFFDLAYQTWHKLLQTRSRRIEAGLFTDDVFCMQNYLRAGVDFLKSTFGVKVLVVRNQFGHPRETAERLQRLLQSEAHLS